jgi:hypothetical protein
MARVLRATVSAILFFTTFLANAGESKEPYAEAEIVRGDCVSELSI